MTLKTRSKILYIVAIIFLIYSLLWATAPFPAINAPARFILDVSDWPFGNYSASLSRELMWTSAIASGLLGAISILLIGIVVPALKSGDQRIINTTIAAFIFWFIVDSGGSYAAGVGSNAVFNSIYLVLTLFPLTGIGKEMVSSNPSLDEKSS